ncbi:uracil phosphoribosyltransferase [Plectosphaerella plurivora]|uniref:uracil phosphoribosyltransferase n=1 Tax=Plectosphaerella plurivora TaxID=936078 RepID=A0A9P8V0U2_9PEZI|nr:uracil phosphoribosyltransferase [Plectosphaerella plurivora]
MTTAETTTDSHVKVLPANGYITALMTTLRDANTESDRFADTVHRLAAQLMVLVLDMIPTEPMKVLTPTGAYFEGATHKTEVCGVSILRAGGSLEPSLRHAYTGPLSFGKILIQRNEETSQPKHIYSKFPPNLAQKTVVILEPMVATGGSASMAVEKLMAEGVPEDKIIFANLIASRQGLQVLRSRFPTMHVVTAAIDSEMTASNHISPGLGDFGDRFDGTL